MISKLRFFLIIQHSRLYVYNIFNDIFCYIHKYYIILSAAVLYSSQTFHIKTNIFFSVKLNVFDAAFERLCRRLRQGDIVRLWVPQMIRWIILLGTESTVGCRRGHTRRIRTGLIECVYCGERIYLLWVFPRWRELQHVGTESRW